MKKKRENAKKEINYISQREYARSRNITLPSVQDAIKYGRLNKSLVKVGKHNKIIPEIADKEWKENTNHDRRPNCSKGNSKANDYGTIKEVSKTEIDQLNNSTENKRILNELPRTFAGLKDLITFEGLAPDIAESRAFFEGYKAKLLELEYKEKQRELIPIDEIKEVWTELLKNFQSKVRSIPTKITPILTASSREEEVERILADSLDEALNELSEFSL